MSDDLQQRLDDLQSRLDAATLALDNIADLCDVPRHEYPGYVTRDVRRLVSLLTHEVQAARRLNERQSESLSGLAWDARTYLDAEQALESARDAMVEVGLSKPFVTATWSEASARWSAAHGDCAAARAALLARLA